jgi:arsenite methyltransferase
VNDSKSGNFDKHGLPLYLDMQADLGYTKHIGGLTATQQLLDLCQISADKSLLNVGCGAGGAITYIAENYRCSVTGVDLKYNMLTSALKWAERKGVLARQAFSTANAQWLPFADGSFDIVICESVNIFIPDRLQAIREYIRVTKSGGYVGLDEPILLGDPTPQITAALAKVVGHALEPPKLWENLLEAGGLTNLSKNTFSVDMRSESRNQMGFFSLSDYLRLIGRIIRSFIFSPYTRNLIKDATAASPSEYMRYMGYGLFVGQKPV